VVDRAVEWTVEWAVEWEAGVAVGFGGWVQMDEPTHSNSLVSPSLLLLICYLIVTNR
jgi:hypothetical protein